MVVDGQNVRDLRKSLAQIRLIEMAGVEVEVGVRHILLVRGGPSLVPPVLLAADGEPLLQHGDLLPDAVGVDLVAEAQLRVKPATLGVLGHDVFPHKSDAAQAIALFGFDVQSEVVAGGGHEAPVGVMLAGDKELVAGAAEMRCDGVCPLGAAVFFHDQIELVAVEGPSLVFGDRTALQLPWVRR